MKLLKDGNEIESVKPRNTRKRNPSRFSDIFHGISVVTWKSFSRHFCFISRLGIEGDVVSCLYESVFILDSMPDNYLLIGNALSGDLVPRKVAACAIKDEAPIGRAVIWP